MATVYLLTGSNLGDRKTQLQQAATLINSQAGTIIAASLLYETAPWGKTDQPSFLNQALCISTDQTPQALLATLLSVEQQMGRVRAERYGPRVIDIDMLLYDNYIVQENGLQIPHPALPHRRFALLPLAEIAANQWHPTLHCTIKTLLEQSEDQSPVQAID